MEGLSSIFRPPSRLSPTFATFFGCNDAPDELLLSRLMSDAGASLLHTGWIETSHHAQGAPLPPLCRSLSFAPPHQCPEFPLSTPRIFPPTCTAAADSYVRVYLQIDTRLRPEEQLLQVTARIELVRNGM